MAAESLSVGSCLPGHMVPNRSCDWAALSARGVTCRARSDTHSDVARRSARRHSERRAESPGNAFHPRGPQQEASTAAALPQKALQQEAHPAREPLEAAVERHTISVVERVDRERRADALERERISRRRTREMWQRQQEELQRHRGRQNDEQARQVAARRTRHAEQRRVLENAFGSANEARHLERLLATERLLLTLAMEAAHTELVRNESRAWHHIQLQDRPRRLPHKLNTIDPRGSNSRRHQSTNMLSIGASAGSSNLPTLSKKGYRSPDQPTNRGDANPKRIRLPGIAPPTPSSPRPE